MPTILCFGDSNTWGHDPATMERFPRDVRWPGVLRRALPPEFEVIEEGLRGRTAVLDDPFVPGLRGLDYLGPCLSTHCPIDLVVLMLGTNDVKSFYPHGPAAIAAGGARLVLDIQRSAQGPKGGAPQVLWLAPPPVAPGQALQEVWGFDATSIARSRELGRYMRAAAASRGCAFMDAGEFVALAPGEGVHLDAAAHAKLGAAVADRVRQLLAA